MCGIAGVWLRRERGEAIDRAIRSVISAMRHRGPEDNGVINVLATEHSTLSLGHARLAILDLTAAGHQPMRDPETGNWIVFSGEIYNHQQLREQLGGRSVHWASRSDTETLLRAYATWGTDCVKRLRGMFAFAIYDAARQSLWCARDRFGIKPFYLVQMAEGFAFASEVRALLRSGLVEPVLDRAALASYVRFGSVSEPRTLVEGVTALPAAHWMEVSSTRILRQVRYWDVARDNSAECDQDLPAARMVRHHLERSVKEHLQSDVPVASFLSGGVDSTIITALAAQQSSRPLRTFTVGFGETYLDETRFASEVAQRYGTEHHELLLSDSEAASLVPGAVAAMDQPSADAVNTFIVSHAVSGTGTKVALSGLGGDELFGGYRSFRLLPLAHRWAKVFGWAASSLPSILLPGGRRSAEFFRPGASIALRYESLRSYWSIAELQAMDVVPTPITDFAAGAHDVRSQVSLLEMQHYMRNTLLRDSDAMSMSHSLELRVPFLDHELVEYAVRHAVMGSENKPILIDATRDLLPDSTFLRPKQGFVLPMTEWMRGPLAGYVKAGLGALHSSRALPQIPLDELQLRFSAGVLPWSRLWQFVVLGKWLELVFGQVRLADTAVNTFTQIPATSSATA